MTSKQIRTHCVLDADGQATLKEAMEALGCRRAHDASCGCRGRRRPRRQRPDRARHVAEAVTFRALDRKLWEK